MKIYINMTYEEFVARFEKDVTYYKINPTIYRCLSLKDELAGGIRKNKFWIQKTTPRVLTANFFRQFSGKIQVVRTGICIKGRFKYANVNILVRTACFLMLIFLFIELINMLHYYFIIILPVFVVCFVFNLIMKKSFKNEDQAVIAYLEGLRDEKVSDDSEE